MNRTRVVLFALSLSALCVMVYVARLSELDVPLPGRLETLVWRGAGPDNQDRGGTLDGPHGLSREVPPDDDLGDNGASVTDNTGKKRATIRGANTVTEATKATRDTKEAKTTLEVEATTQTVQATTGKNKVLETSVSRDVAEDSARRPVMNGPFNISKITHETLYMIVDNHKGRTGNNMFQYAALRGIAARNNRMPALIVPPRKYPEFFEVFNFRPELFTYDPSIVNRTYLYFREELAFTYDARMENLPQTDVKIGNFLQSFKYFKDIEPYIREELQFKKPIRERAQAFLRANTTRYHGDDNSDGPITYVGVHVRNSFSTWTEDETGRMSTPIGFYRRAMSYFRSRFARVQFVMACCNPIFCKTEVAVNMTDVAISDGMSAIEDLALLASCNHTIVSAGTYGWWAAWLANGTTLYHAAFPKKGSRIDLKMKKDDFYPTHWIGVN